MVMSGATGTHRTTLCGRWNWVLETWAVVFSYRRRSFVPFREQCELLMSTAESVKSLEKICFRKVSKVKSSCYRCSEVLKIRQSLLGVGQFVLESVDISAEGLKEKF